MVRNLTFLFGFVIFFLAALLLFGLKGPVEVGKIEKAVIREPFERIVPFRRDECIEVVSEHDDNLKIDDRQILFVDFKDQWDKIENGRENVAKAIVLIVGIRSTRASEIEQEIRLHGQKYDFFKIYESSAYSIGYRQD